MSKLSTSPLASLAIPIGLAPMEAKLVDDLPDEAGWQFEPKWDGFRCLAFRAGDDVDLRAKSGKPLARYFPEVVAQLKELPFTQFVIDGELAIQDGDDLSFDALQMRLHPAESRVLKLAAKTPAIRNPTLRPTVLSTRPNGEFGSPKMVTALPRSSLTTNLRWPNTLRPSCRV